MGATLIFKGNEEERINETAAAIRTFREALPILEALVRDGPGAAPMQPRHVLRYRGRPVLVCWRRDLAWGYAGLGVALQAAGRPMEALPFHEKAVATWRRLNRDYPRVFDYQRALASGLSKLGLVLDEMGQPTQALLSHQEALGIFDRQLHRLESMPDGMAERADTIDWIAAIQHKLGRTAEAIGSYEQARAVIRKLVHDHPAVVRYRQVLCICDTGLAALYRKVGRRARGTRAAGRGPADPRGAPAGLAHVSLPHGLLPLSSHPAHRRGPAPARGRGRPPARRSSDG